jgi:hypothetical protein
LFHWRSSPAAAFRRFFRKTRRCWRDFTPWSSPKRTSKKSLEQLVDTFSINTEGTNEVFKRTPRTYGALLAFQLLMGHGFKAEMELLSKELPKGQDGVIIDLSPFKTSARRCAIQLLELVSANRPTAGGPVPSSSAQTQAP